MAANNEETDKPYATLHILLRDGSVTERGLLQEEVMIGKGSHNDIILPDPSVSSTHAKIAVKDNKFTLSDLGSRNGTYLNDVRISEPLELHHGDRIKMGHCLLTFRIEGADFTLVMPIKELSQSPPPIPPPISINEEELAKALISSGLVAQAEIDRLLETGGNHDNGDSRGKRHKLYPNLIKKNLVSEIGLRDLMSRSFNLSLVDLKTTEVDSGVATLLRQEFLRENLVCPLVGESAERLLIAIADPTDKKTIDEIEGLTHKKASLRIATASEIKEKLDHYFTPRLIGVTLDGRKIEGLLDQVETDIGKASHNRFVIPDPTVSNTHAVIVARDGCYSIVDLGSSNGTIVDGKRLGSEAYTLKHGDKIQLGKVVLTFRNPAETTENRTARLSLESLEAVRNRIVSPEVTGVSSDDVSGSSIGQPLTSNGDEDERKDKKKKKKEGDRIRAALVNSTSRILATILGTVLSVIIAVYYVKQGSQPSGTITKNSSQGSSESGLTLTGSSWKEFNTGFLRASIEASGVAHLPGSNGLIMVSDNSEGEVLWMGLDGDGKQAGPIKSIPLGVSFKDPEAITYGGSYFYLIGSQSDPNDGPQNALVRFRIDPATQSLRGKAEIINDFRSFLLPRVPEIESLGRRPGALGGLNIEGIAWDPNDERLLLGLRSPLFGEKAVLIPIRLRDPHGPFNSDNLSVDDPHVIDFFLEGHGIRDITYDTHSRNFLIISGATENQKKSEFTLWEWTGRSGVNPVKLMTLDEKRKPEGLTDATIDGRSFIFVVADGGGYLKLNYQ
jgi:pSer/pThr/pTyr-binding forkhead associated (FHA) protein